MKRIIDFTISITLLLLLLPLMCFVAILIRMKMGAPILFKQERPGKDGDRFLLYKFRTMRYAQDSEGNIMPDHLRLTRIGRFIRKYSLDELPQLINVLKGEMSLVGPRPLLLEYLPLYTSEQNMRHDVRPGISGWAQVNGRNALTWDEKFKLDIWYVKNQSVLLDIKIILLTIYKVIKRDGIAQHNHVSMEKFTGSNEVI